MIINATGWSVQQINETPWCDVLELLDYWSSTCPPLPVLLSRLSAYYGLDPLPKVKQDQSHAPSSEAEIEEFMNSLGV